MRFAPALAVLCFGAAALAPRRPRIAGDRTVAGELPATA